MTTNVRIEEVSGGVCAAEGFLATGHHTGVKRQDKDLSLLYSPSPCRAAATFTQNRVQAAPLHITKEHLKSGSVRAVVINSGNANACNGPKGLEDARQMAEATAKGLDVAPTEVLVASTGVIGMPLAMDKIEPGIAAAAGQLRADGGADAAAGIMTTDTTPKEAALRCRAGEYTFHLGGMAKGSGMIHPNMATMLAFITTDAPVEEAFLRQSLTEAVDRSFNMISVDGDTSTNDMVLLLANGSAGGSEFGAGSELGNLFQEALTRLCIALARMIVKDGEGASKLIEVCVRGARSISDARCVVRTISKSPLVKTAVYGEDANWGRILCAAGYSGADLDPDHVKVLLDDLLVYADGSGVPFDEAKAKEILEENEVRITVDLGVGSDEATGWTCDLTYDYIKINASYRS